MIGLMFGETALFHKWIFDNFGIDTAMPCEIIGILDDSKIIGAVSYFNYYKHNIEMSIYTQDKRWCTRRNLHTFFAYPFLQLNCLRVTAQVAKMNKASRRLVESCGFKYEGNIRKGQASGDDTIIYGMFQHECRFLRNEKKLSFGTSGT